MLKRFSVMLQYLVPQHILSTVMGCLAESRLTWFKNSFIAFFVKKYQVDMSLAQIEDPLAYPSFNRFFIRELKPALRPIVAGEQTIASPVDGTIAQIGTLESTKLFQAKGHDFDLLSLLGGNAELANQFTNGSYTTIYLAPHDYHRIHMPIEGALTQTIFVPGKLFSVNKLTAANIPQLYSRNERFITVFNTAVGPMAVILVGAMIVGSMQTVWLDQPVRSKSVTIKEHDGSLRLEKGAELGHFKMGSTVILLFGQEKINWLPSLHSDSSVNFGQLIGNFAV